MSKKSGKKNPKKSATKKSSPKPSTAQPSNPSPAPPSTEPSGRRRESPKKSGKRGPRPLDPADDFQQPVKAEASSNGEQPVGEPLFPESPAKKPRQPRLPTMEDPEIEELENCAEAYADIRDQRMALTKEEVPLKDELRPRWFRHQGNRGV